jgi:hypothetical protein
MTEKSICYFSNGLIINSVIPFPEMNTCDKIPQVDIIYGEVPYQVSNIIYEDQYQQIGENEYLLTIPDVADYWVKDKSLVLIKIYPNANIADVRMYFLSAILPLLVHLHLLLPLHSCCINIQGNGFLIGGESGSGKSTLALGMHRKGYTILNDDVSTIDFTENGNVFAYPGYQQIKLLPESLNEYDLKKEDFEKLGIQIEKYKFPINLDRNIESIPIKALFFFEHNEQIKSIDISELKGLDAFIQISKNTFRNQFIKAMNLQKEHFQLCSKIAQKVKVFKISRPKNIQAKEFADFMETTFLNLL